MTIRTLLLAGVTALTLTSCATTSSTPLLTADALLTQPYSTPTAQPFDVASFFDAMPAWMEASFETSEFNAVSGAMEVDNLVLFIKDAPDYRLRVERATLWGADSNALSRVVSGGSLDAMAQIFDRISLEGVRSDGLQWENGAQSLSLNIDKVVFDGLEAQSFFLTPLDNADSETDGAITMVRTLAAIANSYRLDGAVFSNMLLRMNESQGSGVTLSIDQAFSRDYDRGRTGYERIDGLKMSTKTQSEGALIEVAERIEESLSQNPEEKILQPWMQNEISNALQNPIAFIAQNAGALTTDREVDTLEVRNSDFTGALSWLAQWKLPPISETNLLDFGAISVIGNREAWNGRELYSVARSEIEALDFYWLIPSNYVQTDSGVKIALLDAIDMGINDFGYGATADTGSREILQIREAVIALGLETIQADSVTRWNWNGETGALNTNSGLFVDELASIGGDLAMDGPSLEEWDALISNGASGDAIAKTIFLNQMSFSITDDQLLGRAFDYAASQMAPGSTGADLRQSAPAVIRLSGGQAAALNDRIPAYVDALATFVSSGGTIRIDVQPTEPVSLSTLQQTETTAPQTLPDIMGLSVTQSAQ